MSRKGFPSDQMDQFVVRLPEGIRDAVKATADANGRSMNSELIIAIEKHLAANGVDTPSTPRQQGDTRRLDTFVAAALSGLIAKGFDGVHDVCLAARDVGQRMLDVMEDYEEPV